VCEKIECQFGSLNGNFIPWDDDESKTTLNGGAMGSNSMKE